MPDISAARTSSTSPDTAETQRAETQRVETEMDSASRMERLATDLYHVASMLLGEGEDAIRLVEQAIGDADGPAGDVDEAERNLRRRLAGTAIALLARRDAQALAAPEVDPSGPVSCIEGDELDAAGVTSAELEAMLTGPDNAHLRAWLESLPETLRVTFVLRAVAGFNSGETAGLLGEYGGPAAENWNPEGVRIIFRQALCSLAAQLLHATAER
jgi:DNA-directed RNA polymerase specialized sigma24 family protein